MCQWVLPKLAVSLFECVCRVSNTVSRCRIGLKNSVHYCIQYPLGRNKLQVYCHMTISSPCLASLAKRILVNAATCRYAKRDQDSQAGFLNYALARQTVHPRAESVSKTE